ncbi:MAG: beta-ketoacyl-[acyl-carrier-protein] synthase family protein [Betaproteobacteria bacterium]|nr:beta-ketoacyl-[acyl-carrier-protein] synthase family protein [Betaproteobacteria bacterium]
MNRGVAITGIGVVAPHGDTADRVFGALLDGESAVHRWDRDDVPPTVVASAPFDGTAWFTRLQLSGMDRVSQMAAVAAERARADAGLDRLDSGSGLFVGTGTGGATSVDDGFTSQRKSGRLSPLTVPASMANAPAAHIAIREGIHGPVYTYSVACASSAIAIAEAARAIRRGDIDFALAGGSEALLVPGFVRAWQAMRTLADAESGVPAHACRPFSAARTGLVLGEGAAFLFLEPVASAAARGIRIYAELAGSGVSCDATHLTKPDASGQVRALTAALRDSHLTPEEVGYCNAHGTGTVVGDVVECEALHRVWGHALPSLAVSSTKSMHGHLLGAAGALEAVVTAMSVYRQAVPPSMHCEDPDPACGVHLVRESRARVTNLDAAISNSFAFGGTNAVLAFRRVDPVTGARPS